jgi:peptidoglycan-associated lipoprotein
MKNQLLVGLACFAIALGGCATKRAASTVPPAGSEVPAASSTPAPGASTAGIEAPASTVAAAADTGEGVAGPRDGLLGKRIIYFDFDRAEIRADGTEIVAAHARYLASHVGSRVRLEGHTDERGTREYNIGLAERRAQAVRHALMLQGVAESQLSTVSYGEERPAATGHDESAWSLNRRVEIVYLTP